VGFGGPIALVGYMQRDLVERRGWFTTEEFREGLALAQLAPGPLAAQVAIYLGWLRGGVAGATAAGLAFVAPSFAMVMALSAAYLAAGGLPWMRGAFYGVGAAVIAIIARSAVKLARLTLGRDRLLWAVFALNAAVTAWTGSELVAVLLASGLVVLAAREARARARLRAGLPNVAAALALPVWAAAPLAAALPGAAGGDALWRIFWYFTRAGAVVFGSGLAIVPFLYGGVVREYGWLTDRQFLDAVAVSMITPGPVVITVAFIGYLTAGPLGGLLAAIGVFLPVYLAVVLLAPSFRRWAANPRLRAAVDGLTAAAAGAIAGAAVVLGRRAIVDLPALLIALGTLAALLLLGRRAPEPALIAAAGVVGVLMG
jgi:chromate transporter